MTADKSKPGASREPFVTSVPCWAGSPCPSCGSTGTGCAVSPDGRFADCVAPPGKPSRAIPYHEPIDPPRVPKPPPSVPGLTRDPANPLGARSLDTVDGLAVDWLWRGRVPFGMLTMLDGDPGLGKSSVAFDLAARLTRGAAMPLSADPPPAPAGVLLLCAEDSAAHTLRPRMEATGAVLSRVFDITAAVTLPGDLPAIEKLVIDHGVKLVVIDPVMSFLAAGVDANGDQSARMALTPLKGLAERTGAAVVLVRHLNKKNGESAAYRGGGSIAFNAAARSALIVGRDPGDQDVSILAPMKCNVGRRPDPVAYAVVETPVTLASGKVVMMPTVEWGELRPDLSADDICTRPDPKSAAGNSRKRDEAKDWLASHLARGPASKSDLEATAEQAGLTWRTAERAATDLGVEKSRVGFGGGSVWSLPSPVRACVHREGLAGMGEVADETLGKPVPAHSRQGRDFEVAGMGVGGNGGNGQIAQTETLILEPDDRPEGVR